MRRITMLFTALVLAIGAATMTGCGDQGGGGSGGTGTGTGGTGGGGTGGTGGTGSGA